MRQKDFCYYTCCVISTAELICPMVDQAREITWRTFSKYVSIDHLRELWPFCTYSYRGEKYNPITGGLTALFSLKRDWAVRYFKSKFDGKPCYYICHSGIEYVSMQVETI